MGNRVYFTLRDKKGSACYYQHWNGGLDTFCPIIDVAFAKGIEDKSRIVQLLQDLGFKPEFQEQTSINTVEENGHYLIDLTDKSFIRRYEQLVKLDGKTFYDLRTEVLPKDMREAFERYLLQNIKIEYHDSVREEYWNQLRQAASDFFDKTKTELEKAKDEAAQFIKESPYGLTAKEKSFIKKKLKSLETDGVKIEASFTRHSKTIRAKVSKVPNDRTWESFRGEIEEKLRAAIEPHQVCYAERDMYTDYSGLYRIDFIYFRVQKEGEE